MALFTPEELEALRLADEEIDEGFRQTQEEIVASRKRDRAAKLEAMDPQKRKIAAQRAAYYEANKEKIAAQKAAYREANRPKYNAYMRDYMRKRRAAQRAAAAT